MAFQMHLQRHARFADADKLEAVNHRESTPDLGGDPTCKAVVELGRLLVIYIDEVRTSGVM
ncbi:hypothetical protein SNOG_03892 [Parastagonospora nodorum SN15]|uniref:Uncharacterized protein n=1 Tax=Phaeosphaeria nodorum (strain SN15 / ATCC MYA-4574 / FGSC 10173) TaxID=321614 RepID=Q0UWH2_PHANO|nr:hypothetical protein SNOG_03892 [Parastagonospora nodorum SN15]EAT89097.1 hypothetical protein SNOG_03892 [Parastagonospora nodorum SN15]